MLKTEITCKLALVASRTCEHRTHVWDADPSRDGGSEAAAWAQASRSFRPSLTAREPGSGAVVEAPCVSRGGHLLTPSRVSSRHQWRRATAKLSVQPQLRNNPKGKHGPESKRHPRRCPSPVTRAKHALKVTCAKHALAPIPKQNSFSASWQ